ncbi:aph-1 protein domain-containing protein [Ditylenchus destructor]|uniref:Aph-1 protein domain-containing protein n=1 Tax=Ditylenchus destructor TaxID=166010 RepID=A0AAD4R6I1_9BILA|nr:aph-1 protein domain-containing protein [Ditylenchus destructor]
MNETQAAFFWLTSLLISAILWRLVFNSLIVSIFVSAICQEIARGLYYFLLHKAQIGLGKLASNGVEVTGIRLLYSSRHILAIVCGLGMGMMAALFLLTNIIAESSHDGVVGLPATIPEAKYLLDDPTLGWITQTGEQVNTHLVAYDTHRCGFTFDKHDFEPLAQPEPISHPVWARDSARCKCWSLYGNNQEYDISYDNNIVI